MGGLRKIVYSSGCASVALANYGDVMTIQIKDAPMLCLDVKGGGTTDGTPVDIWECNGSENQLWYFAEGSNQIRYAGAPDKCVDAGDMKEGSQLKLWTCNGLAQQKWDYDPKMSTVYLAGAAADASVCMDLAGGKTAGGTAIQNWACNGQWGQQWVLSPGMTIRASWNYHLCLDLPGGSTDNGKNLWLWDCNGSPNQKWFFHDYGIFFAGNPKKCLDAGDMQAGSKLQVWDCVGNDQQKWGYDAKTSAVYLAASQKVDASMCMDAAGGGAKAGVTLDVWNCNSCWNQGFSIVGPAAYAQALNANASQMAVAPPNKLTSCPPKPGPDPSPAPAPVPGKPLRNLVGQGFDVTNANLWGMTNLYPVAFLSQDAPDACFREQPCSHESSYHSDSLNSTTDWQNKFSSSMGLNAGGSYSFVKASIAASFSSTFSDQSLADKTAVHVQMLNRRKCYEVDADCLFKKEYLHPMLSTALQELPVGKHDEEMMKAWEHRVVTHFGTHINVASEHGAMIQSLTSVDTSCHTSSDCLQQEACLSFSYLTQANASVCGNRTGCTSNNGCTSMIQKSCVISGGDESTVLSHVCGKDSTQQEIDAFLASGDMTSPQSAFAFTFKPVAQVLEGMGFDREGSMYEKAVEYHSCTKPGHAWRQDANGDYGCSCTLQCGEHGVVDTNSCTCSCFGDELHGWTGAMCDQPYGQCQRGAGSGNTHNADKCSLDGTCASAFWGGHCAQTEVCCLSDFGGTCCPYGSNCNCGAGGCSCEAPPAGCAKPDTWSTNWGKSAEERCQTWWSDCQWGACKDWSRCAPGSWGAQQCGGTCCQHRAGYPFNFSVQESFATTLIV